MNIAIPYLTSWEFEQNSTSTIHSYVAFLLISTLFKDQTYRSFPNTIGVSIILLFLAKKKKKKDTETDG